MQVSMISRGLLAKFVDYFVAIGIGAAIGFGVAVFTGKACAADLPAKAAAAPIATPAYALPWSGAYIGAQFGYGVNPSGLNVSATGLGSVDVGNNASGFIGGGRLGYDWNTGSFVFGVVTDLNYADLTGSNSFAQFASASAKTGWLGSTNLRFGLPAGNWMPYIIAGPAYGQCSAAIAVGNFGTGFDSTCFGWDAGGGIEAQIPGTKLSFFVEGKWVDFGTKSFSIPGNFIGATQNFNSFDGLVGVNYHF